MNIHYGGSGHTCPAFGMAGGKPGAVASHWTEDAGSGDQLVALKNAGNTDVPEDQVWVAETGGGGGSGDPYARDPEAVLADVADGFVSIDAARTAYGVIVTNASAALAIDLEATHALRASLRSPQ